LVSFSAVAKRYPGGKSALESVSFALEAGELAFLIGRSGAGKSTLLKLIPAIERPTSGAVIVNGQNVGALKRGAIPYLRRNIGLVFQDQKLLYDRNVYENVMLPLSFSGQPSQEAARRVRAALDKVGLLPREKANPIELSGGEQQRLAIARAVVNRPALLIADEPTTALDVTTQAGILTLLGALPTALLLISHDIAVVGRICSRLAVVRRGKVVEQGPAARVLAEPAHPYTRDLVAAAAALDLPS